MSIIGDELNLNPRSWMLDARLKEIKPEFCVRSAESALTFLSKDGMFLVRDEFAEVKK